LLPGCKNRFVSKCFAIFPIAQTLEEWLLDCNYYATPEGIWKGRLEGQNQTTLQERAVGRTACYEGQETQDRRSGSGVESKERTRKQ